MNDQSQNDMPEKSAGDIAHSTTKAILSLIPVVGGGATEIFTFLVTPPIEKRRDEWIQSVIEGLEALQEKFDSFRIEILGQNEMWISTLLEASRTVVTTHQKEKRLALRNAVLNAALPQAPDETRQKMFIQWLDELTEWHIKILKLFDTRSLPEINLDSSEWYMNVATRHLTDSIKSTYPQLRDQFDLCLQIVKDLHLRGLISNLLPSKSGAAELVRSPELMALAKEFLAFISSPLEDDNLQENSKA